MDETNPLNRASFYIERIKYGEGDRQVESVPPSNVAVQLDRMLKDAGIDHVTGEQIVAAHFYYGRSFALSLRGALGVVPTEQIYGSVFMDGVMHGIAVAARLEADAP